MDDEVGPDDQLGTSLTVACNREGRLRASISDDEDELVRDDDPSSENLIIKDCVDQS